MNGKIYKATCKATGQHYIGMTCSSLPKRIELHHLRAEVDGSTSLFHTAIREYGRDAFDWEILHCDVRSMKVLKELEQSCMIEFNSMRPNGLNTGAIRGKEHYAVTRGFTPEHRAKISKAAKKRKIDPATRAKIADGMRRYHERRRAENAINA